jgi:galactitol-specific phosphotransferase system IIC component
MSERYAKSIKVLIGQFVENGDIDIVVGKALGVLGQAEFFEPLLNLLHLRTVQATVHKLYPMMLTQ